MQFDKSFEVLFVHRFLLSFFTIRPLTTRKVTLESKKSEKICLLFENLSLYLQGGIVNRHKYNRQLMFCKHYFSNADFA